MVKLEEGGGVVLLIYKHTNLINNKVYIGITKYDNPKQRWKCGAGYRDQFFYKDIEKYGWDNFLHEIIENNLSIEEANRLEQELIALYQSDNEEFGYNVSKGGGYNIRAPRHQEIEKANNHFSSFLDTVPKEDKELFVSDFLKKYSSYKEQLNNTRWQKFEQQRF